MNNLEMIKIYELTKIHKTNGYKIRGLPPTSLKIAKGESVIIKGPNGCGKSTLLKILATLWTPTSGTVNIDGFDIYQDGDKIRGLIGYIPEQPVFDNFMNARDVWAIFKSLRRKKNLKFEIYENYLKELNLINWIDKPIGIYSAGMKKRVSLALWLSMSPKILLLDELDSSLDQNALGIISDILNNENLTLVSISHMKNYELKKNSRIVELIEHQQRSKGGVKINE